MYQLKVGTAVTEESKHDIQWFKGDKSTRRAERDEVDPGNWTLT